MLATWNFLHSTVDAGLTPVCFILVHVVAVISCANRFMHLSSAKMTTGWIIVFETINANILMFAVDAKSIVFDRSTKNRVRPLVGSL